MTVDYQEIGPAIVVIIEKPGAPANVRQAYRRHFSRVGNIGKRTLAVVVIESIVIIVEVRNEQVEFAVVIIIAECHAHAPLLTSVFIYRHTCGKPNILEGTVPIVVIEKVRSRIIGDKDIHQTIAIKIARNYTQSVVPARIIDAGLL